MPGFSITPVAAFPPASNDGFPRFLQFQHDGTDVGDTAIETVNFTGEGVTGMTVNSAGSTLTIDLSGGGTAAFTWLDVPGDYTLAITDAGNGLAATGATGAQAFTIPPAADVLFDEGTAIVILQDGQAQVQVVAGAGVELIYRPVQFNPYTAGEGAVLTLLYRGNDRWVVCGDLETAA